MTEEEIKRKIYNKVQHLSWKEFEVYCAELLKSCGYKNVKVTRFTKDGGVDIYAVAYKNGHYFPVCFQVKKYLGSWKVSGRQVEKFANSPGYKQAEASNIITLNGGYTNPAIKYTNELGIRRIDGQDLMDIAYKHNAGFKEDGSLNQAYWDEIARKTSEADKKK